MKVLFIGDIVGKPGRKVVKSKVVELREEYGIDLVLANGENSAGGLGLTPDTAEELLQSGVDIITSGNHIWKHKEIVPYLDGGAPVIRPLNYPEGVPGKGYLFWNEVLVVNLLGRVFMDTLDCPFRTIDHLLNTCNPRPKAVLVDFHAEATSEKNALGIYLDGRVSAVIGTHTHIGTVDARVLPRGTAFVTDVGMVGPKDSIIGNDPKGVIGMFLTGMPHRFAVGKGKSIFNSVLVDIDNGMAKDIRRVDLEME